MSGSDDDGGGGLLIHPHAAIKSPNGTEITIQPDLYEKILALLKTEAEEVHAVLTKFEGEIEAAVDPHDDPPGT